jgi:hypothetical protein
VEPEYWNAGVSVLLFAEMARRAWAKGYRWSDLSLTSEMVSTGKSWFPDEKALKSCSLVVFSQHDV